MAAESAAAFFTTGALPFESALAANLPDSVHTVAMLGCIEPLFGTHDNCTAHHHHHDHGMPDPHIWTSARNARAMAAAMAAELTRLDPDGAAIYAARLDSLDRRIAAADSTIATTLAGAPARAFVVWHPSLSYFARDYGLRQVAVGTEGKEFSAAAMRAAIDSARTAGAAVFVMQRGADSGRAEGICRAAGLRKVEVDMLAPDNLQQLTTLADELSHR